ncbi:MAG TPA: glycogen synthase GlgA [Patescibacteria group bacterium]|nr:glycogen synthase GlgA [Patescibacteria group bacterium]
MIASEMAPLAKVGGLADVVGALSAALVSEQHDVRVVLPGYAAIDLSRHTVKNGPNGRTVEVAAGNGARVTVHLVESDRHFGRPGIYNDPKDGKGYADNAERFIFFQREALALLKRLGFAPDVIHLHDHQTALIPAYLRKDGDPFFAETGTLFTVHNLGYQGLFPVSVLEAAGFDRSVFYPMSPFEFWGQVNFMKVGLSLADVITTVSPTYAKEICTPEQGCGLEGVLQARQSDLHGVLNGIDDDYWNPSKDQHLAHHYDAGNLAGKTLCRTELLKTMGLPASRKRMPLIGIISRLTEQKGFDLIEQAMPDLMRRELKIVVLGAGEEKYVRLLREAQAGFPARVSVRVGFDEALAHLIEAGSDMFLMPSRYEPCGLNQMYSLAYGTVPVVRATGGLADTVREEGSGGNGFVFNEYEASAMTAAVDRALAAFADKKKWTRLMQAGMQGDYSWARSAQTYATLYAQARERARGRVTKTTQYA